METTGQLLFEIFGALPYKQLGKARPVGQKRKEY
jgi:hypothetical protein